MVKRVDERLTDHAIDEGVHYVGVGDVGELIMLLGETLDALPEGLIRPLPIVVEVPRVLGLIVRTSEVADKDRAEIALAADATRLELLKPGSSRA